TGTVRDTSFDTFVPRPDGTFRLDRVVAAPPTLSSLSPSSAVAGGPGFTLAVNGSSFLNGAVVLWNGSNRATTFVSAIRLTASIPASDIAMPGTAQVTVLNPSGDISNPLTFTIAPPVPNSILNFPRVFVPTGSPPIGFALVNPTATPATVFFTLYGPSGVAISSSTQTVPARGQLARLGSEFFPNVSDGGWVQATSAVTGLQGFWLAGDFVTYTDGAEAAVPGSDQILPLVTNATEVNIANVNVGPI